MEIGTDMGGMEDMERIVEEYENFIDENLVAFAQKVRDKVFKHPSKRDYSLGLVSERGSNDINSLTGVDVTGYEHILKGSAVEHIEKRHGVKGEHNRSMADINDYGRIGYVLENYDIVELLHDRKGNVKHSTGFLNSSKKPSPMIIYKKRINGTFYVVEAVPETSVKQLQIISVYKEKAKNRGGQMLDVLQIPQLNVRNAYAAAPVKKEGGQVLDAVQTPKPHVRNVHAATLTDNVINLPEKVNTQDQNLPQQPESEAL